jgi:hypothetical protein
MNIPTIVDNTILTYLVETIQTLLPDSKITITQRQKTSSPTIVIENKGNYTRDILVTGWAGFDQAHTALICHNITPPSRHTTITHDDYNNHDTVVNKLKHFLRQLKFEQI